MSQLTHSLSPVLPGAARSPAQKGMDAFKKHMKKLVSPGKSRGPVEFVLVEDGGTNIQRQINYYGESPAPITVALFGAAASFLVT